jgi:amino acid transporter
MALDKNSKWTHLALMTFVMVWGFGNVVINFATQGLSVVFSWVVIMVIYFIPYALMVGELGSVYKNCDGGVKSWIRNAEWSNKEKGALLAYFAGWTYWVVHVPYLAQKPQAAIIAFGWAVRQNGSLVDGASPLVLQFFCLVLFLALLILASRGFTSLRRVSTVAGMSVFVLSFLYVLLVWAAPALRGMKIATPNLLSIKTYMPQFGLEYFATISFLVFAVGGAEKISPYVSKLEHPSRDFPKSMIALAVMVAGSAILGSIAMGMMFDAENRPADLMMNGAYYAFQQLGEHYGVGNLLLVIYALSNLAAQLSVTMLSIDAPLKVLLLDADTRFIPKSMTKVNKEGAPVNGYIMTAVLVGILIMVPALGIESMNDVFNFLLRLNTIVMPMRYLWVFFAYMLLRNALNEAANTATGYRFVKNRYFGRFIGGWCFLFTAIACILGMRPSGEPGLTEGWYFQLTLNILAPVIFIILGLIMPVFAKRARTAV